MSEFPFSSAYPKTGGDDVQGAERMADTEREGEGYLTPDEIRAELARPGPEASAKIAALARWFSRRCGIPPDDLMQEAFRRLLDGSRRMRRDSDCAAVVAGVMKSLASAEVDAIRAGKRRVLPAPDGTQGNDIADPSPSPERVVASILDDGPTLDAMRAAIEDNEQLQLLFEGICDRMRGDELEELLRCDTKELATARRRLKRRLQGWSRRGTEQ